MLKFITIIPQVEIVKIILNQIRYINFSLKKAINLYGKMNFLLFLKENKTIFSTHQLGVLIQLANRLLFLLPCPIDQDYINL